MPLESVALARLVARIFAFRYRAAVGLEIAAKLLILVAGFGIAIPYGLQFFVAEISCGQRARGEGLEAAFATWSRNHS